ncbi:MAG: hypothetical protein K0U64_02780 [Actinomycetia bacterium]|nr:hypothetical protein [Actinomycetes bacterium]
MGPPRRERAAESTPKKDLITGPELVMEDADPQERKLMMSAIPAVPRLLYTFIGKRAYIKNATAVRGVAPTGL